MMHGVLNVYKERGYTSHDVVAKLRGITGQRKIGHTGTLDPDAKGVLPVCLGRATKLCGMLTDKDKCYEAVMLLGMETDTQDITGKIVKTGDISKVTKDETEQAVLSFTGDYEQVPPMYSALKIDGKKLYELAREGKTVERKARKVTIYKIEILKTEFPRVYIRVHCSKGTYIRTLCHDIGEKLGCGACMESLVRTRAGVFGIEDSLTLAEIESKVRGGALEEILIPIARMFPDYREAFVEKGWETAAYNGNALPQKGLLVKEMPEDSENFRVYDSRGTFLGIYRYEEERKEYKLVKMFFLRERD